MMILKLRAYKYLVKEDIVAYRDDIDKFSNLYKWKLCFVAMLPSYPLLLLYNWYKKTLKSIMFTCF